MQTQASIAISSPERAQTLCLHCGNPLDAAAVEQAFCCAGCRAVHQFLKQEGMQAFYQVRPKKILPLLNYFSRAEPADWVDGLAGLEQGRALLAVEGVQCGACVWAIEKIAAKSGGASVAVNTALGRLRLRFDPARFDLKAYVRNLARLGFRVRPLDQSLPDPSRPLLLRLGICAAAAMNTMFFSIALYLGLKPGADGLYKLLHHLNFSLSTVAVAVGGGYFFARAWHSLRRGVLHFDVPIAIGIAAAYAGSAWMYLHGRHEESFFDSLNVFIVLMLTGRFLQERGLVRNRRSLLKAQALSSFKVTLLARRPEEIRFDQVKAGQKLLLQPGSLCPAESRIHSRSGVSEFDLSSVTGEAEAVRKKTGDPLPAGARLLSDRAVTITTTAAFEEGLLAKLLPDPSSEEEPLPFLWQWTVRWYVLLVLGAAFGGLAWWLWKDPAMAPKVFVSVLVVTCPCGLGIAVPLARTLANRRLLEQGVIARRPGYLDRLREVRDLYFDKTGTLTLSELKLKNPRQLERLSQADQRRLLAACLSSRHPVSRALAAHLTSRGVLPASGGVAQEKPGQGVWWREGRRAWFLGRKQRGARYTQFSLNGKRLASFDLQEDLLGDAATSVATLQARGLNVHLLSGDRPSRVLTTAKALGLDSSRAHGGASPEVKAATVGNDSMMIGDGLNDGQALTKAKVSGAPAWEHHGMNELSDFYFVSASLRWLPAMFDTASRLHRAIWLNLFFAAAYNGVLVSLALSGLVSPLVCAVVMPLSSLLVIGLTARAMGRP